jgi:nicotinate phosphoribosyltransferase
VQQLKKGRGRPRPFSWSALAALDNWLDRVQKRHVQTASALLTDLYQLTMAYGYWKSRMHEREAVFHLFFRKAPFASGFTVAAGLAPVIEALRGLRFEPAELAYLRSLALFDEAFLESLRTFRFVCDVDAMPEGTTVFPHEPLIRVQGPLLQAQLVETLLLNIVNFQTLIATKAARIVEAAHGASVLEFGLRRAHGNDGGLSASRAAFLGGCEATSNVQAGHLWGIPVRGTHAHSWVMAFDDEREAFAAYAQAMPGNVTFLVDTYDSLDGVRHAVEAGQRLREQGSTLQGIRLDSGDLAWLSIEARRILDEGGFPDAKIVASNDLDEHIITSLRQQGAKIDIWGVGTKLVTAYDQPALGGVYKLGALRNADGSWQHKIKLSEQTAKTSIPGILQVRRFSVDGQTRGDMIWDLLEGEPSDTTIVDPADPMRRRAFAGSDSRDLLIPVFRSGDVVYEPASLSESQAFVTREVRALHPSIRRLTNPHVYPAGLEERLYERRKAMIAEERQA